MEFFQSIYFIELIGFVVATALAFLGGRQSSGTGKVLGEEYGKVNYFTGFLRWLFLGISLLLAFLLLIVFAIDFFMNFFKSSLTYVLCFAVGFALYLFVFYKELNKGSEILEKKYEKEINAILMRNPIFKDALDKINKDDSIKMVHVFRDGIAFFKYSFACTSENEKIEFGASSSSDAKNILKAKAENWVRQHGSVITSGSNDIISYSSYGYSSSETAMQDIGKHLYRLTKPRFLCDAYEKSWDYHRVTYYSSGRYYIHNNIATPTGGSSETIDAHEKATAYINLHVKIQERKEDVAAPLKKW